MTLPTITWPAETRQRVAAAILDAALPTQEYAFPSDAAALDFPDARLSPAFPLLRTLYGIDDDAPAAERVRTVAEAERGTAKQAAAILGLKPRKLQAMSQRGKIPGAAKLGRQWTYDLAKLRGFVEQQEQAITCENEKPRPGATGGAIPCGAALGSGGGSSGGRLKQMIQQSQKRVAKLAKRER
jgi:hypothetical protein